MECKASFNEKEYMPLDTNALEGNEDVPVAIHPREAQPQSEQAAISDLPMEVAGGDSGCNDEERKEVDGDEKYSVFRKYVARHVWSKYMRLMIGKKLDEEDENSSSGEYLETTLCF